MKPIKSKVIMADLSLLHSMQEWEAFWKMTVEGNKDLRKRNPEWNEDGKQDIKNT